MYCLLLVNSKLGKISNAEIQKQQMCDMRLCTNGSFRIVLIKAYFLCYWFAKHWTSASM